ncbi:MAG TPA: flagellin [Fimbriimonadaceae bacterium]|nr:flagellin [Fimbriimonadaceae bacterium]
MSLRINSNLSAMGALRNLQQTNLEMNGSITRLSTGLRINNAADDPAGLIISEGMRTQLRGIGQALRNSQDAINMAKTAEGALDEVQRLLRDVRALAVHSANSGAIDNNALQANQTQIRSTLQSINRIAEQTTFGSKKLLDGSAGIMANVTNASFSSGIGVSGTFAGESISSGPVTVTRVTAATKPAVTMGKGFANSTAIVTTSGSFVINGYSINSSGTETVQSLVAKINEISSTTGVVAQITGTSPVTIALQNTSYGARNSINFFDPSNVIHNASSASSTGVDAVYNVSMTTSAGVTTVPFTGGRGPGDSGLRLGDSNGNVIQITETGNSTTGATQIGFVTAGAVKFQIGANTDQSVSFSMPVVFANRLGTGAIGGKSLADLDVTTPQGAQDAMKIIDDAVSQLAKLRGDLGSFQKNFMESNIRSLGVANENLTSSESSIRDADMAEEMTRYTRLQILTQSGMSVLAQANQLPQNVLQLLRGS